MIQNWYIDLEAWKLLTEEKRQYVTERLAEHGYEPFVFHNVVYPVRKGYVGKPLPTNRGKTLHKDDTLSVEDWRVTPPEVRAAIEFDLLKRNLCLERDHPQPHWPGSGYLRVHKSTLPHGHWPAGTAPYDLVPDPAKIDAGENFIASIAARDQAEAYAIAEKVFRDVAAKVVFPQEREDAYRTGYCEGFRAAFHAMIGGETPVGDIHCHAFRGLKDWQFENHRGEHTPPPTILPAS